MSSVADVYDNLNLFVTSDKFYIQARTENRLLIIDRITETISVENDSNQIPSASNCRTICGILGSIRLLAGRYLIIATGREYIGSIAGHSIWRLVNSEILPYTRSTLHLNAQQIEDNATYLNMIEQVLGTPYLYFSYTYDITHTTQRLHSTEPAFLSRPLLDRADQRFVWNKFVLSDFATAGLYKFCLPLLHGFISINEIYINDTVFNWSIISRRSVYRAGTRLFKRGIDKLGNVANFVETEQLVEFQGDRASFVQIRGSIPLFWSQLPDLRYKPPPQLLDIDLEEQQSASARHFESLMLLYGRHVLIDLVDQKGSEGKLQSAYKEIVQRLNFPFVKYEPFDFHAECRHMQWDRLSILLNRVSLDQDEMGFFLLLKDGSLPLLQDGVFRTNCIDCLDRTNVVQSMLAKRCLLHMLQKLSILSTNQTIENFENLETKFKEVWADNADLISMQYSGTGALKTDFTRTGKRTRLGLFKDGLNSITRYYKNNFSDGFRQDAIDIFHGSVEILSPLKVDRGWRYVTFPSVLLVAVAMCVACTVLPAEYSTESLLFLMFWASMVAATSTTILRHGPEFVDKPRLTALLNSLS